MGAGDAPGKGGWQKWRELLIIPCGDGFPSPRSLEMEVAYLSHSPLSARFLGDEVDMGNDLIHRVGRRGGEAHPAQDRDIDDVVPHEGDPGIVKAGFIEDIKVWGELVQGLLVNTDNPKLRGTIGDNLGLAA